MTGDDIPWLAETLPPFEVDNLRAQAERLAVEGPSASFVLQCRNLARTGERGDPAAGRPRHGVGGQERVVVVLDANPLDDVTNSRRISAVYLRGEPVDREALRARFRDGVR